MREDIYKAAMAFLNRVDLKGSEVQAFEAVRAELANAQKYGIAYPQTNEEKLEADAEEN